MISMHAWALHTFSVRSVQWYHLEANLISWDYPFNDNPAHWLLGQWFVWNQPNAGPSQAQWPADSLQPAQPGGPPLWHQQPQHHLPQHQGDQEGDSLTRSALKGQGHDHFQPILISCPCPFKWKAHLYIVDEGLPKFWKNVWKIS